MCRPAKTTSGLGRLGLGPIERARVDADDVDRAAEALGPQPPLVEAREAERALADAGREPLDRPGDRPLEPAEIAPPVGERPDLDPVDEQPVAAAPPREARREQREERRRARSGRRRSAAPGRAGGAGRRRRSAAPARSAACRRRRARTAARPRRRGRPECSARRRRSHCRSVRYVTSYPSAARRSASARYQRSAPPTVYG